MSDVDRRRAALAQIVGANNVLVDPALTAEHLREPRDLYRGAALAVVRPGTTAETSAIVAFCAREGIPITPQGGNTGLVGGQIPDQSGGQIVLSTRRLNRVRAVDPFTDVMTAEAGVTLTAARAAAEAADRLFPLSLASEGSCTIGGNLSTNAGGVAVLAYGNARELTLGVEVVLADGRVVDALGKLRKDNTGYDLKDLFVGSEGTLGIITAATLKLFPRPRAQATAFVAVADPKAALALLGLARAGFGAMLTSFELLPRFALDLVLSHFSGARDPLGASSSWYVLLEISSPTARAIESELEDVLAAAAERGIVADAAIATSLSRRAELWALRENVSEAQKREGVSIKHDISVPVGAVPDFLHEADAAVAGLAPTARIIGFGHLGDGNIHYNVMQPLGEDGGEFRKRWDEISAAVHEIVGRFSGSISAEHGIGLLKRDLLARTKNKEALDVMRRIKTALDPTGLLNPGKVLVNNSRA